MPEEFPARPIVVALPLAVYEQLAALAAPDSVEVLAAELLAEAVELGSPGELHAAAHLASEAAELLAARWAQRQAALAQIATGLRAIAAALGRLAAEG
jgi:hypothetical protein